MGLLDFLRNLLFPADASPAPPAHSGRAAEPPAASGQRTSPAASSPRPPVVEEPARRPRLVPLRYRSRGSDWRRSSQEEVDHLPYRFAQRGVRYGGYLDLTEDADVGRLEQLGLPILHTPEQIAVWLDRPLGQVAWLIHRFSSGYRPENEGDAHYHYRWMRKKSGGWRLIEAPKPILRTVQQQILAEILDQVPVHSAAHGFTAGRSIVTNAAPHAGQQVLVQFDLENFYATVGLARVTAVFRSLGYCREAAIWLARLTTSALPQTAAFPDGDTWALLPFLPRHLPQGAPTSPALANLSAFSLDVRLEGFAASWGTTYTRYADDITFSGSRKLLRALPKFIPLVERIIRQERFLSRGSKRRVVRDCSRQVVTGVVVNSHPNLSRPQYDRLKAILTNCIRQGPSTQNREDHPDFAGWLRGHVAHAMNLNRERGLKLKALYDQVDWRR